MSNSEFALITLKTGIKSLRSIDRGETFHPVTGPWVEANVLHVAQQRLKERAKKVDRFVIWDVGFGAAANVLAAIQELTDVSSEIEIHSFDQTLAPIEFALKNAVELEYLVPFQDQIQQLLKDKKIEVNSQMSWNLHLGDFREMIQQHKFPAPHAIFYDPYSPVGNPDMWTLEHFSRLRQCLNPERPCLLTNYTRSTAVRATLLLAGFYVGQGLEVGEKAETTIASNQLELLNHPLKPEWLKRVQNSTNAAPMRSSVAYTKSKISETDLSELRKLPQFVERLGD